MCRKRPFRVERRPPGTPVAPRPEIAASGLPTWFYAPSAVRAAGIAAVRAELDRRPVAEDVGRLTRRGGFPREMFASAVCGG